MSGTKFDQEKPDMSLLSRAFLEQVASCMGYGAKKYGRHNYLGGMAHSRLMAACLRHLAAYNDGESIDSESGINHLAHAAANINMLLDFLSKGIGIDDRYIVETTSMNEAIEHLIDAGEPVSVIGTDLDVSYLSKKKVSK